MYYCEACGKALADLYLKVECITLRFTCFHCGHLSVLDSEEDCYISGANNVKQAEADHAKAREEITGNLISLRVRSGMHDLERGGGGSARERRIEEIKRDVMYYD